MRRVVATIALLAAGLARPARPALAQAEDPGDSDDDIDAQVARSLFEQGLKLFHAGRYADARQLFAESIARAPDGTYVRSARQMLARCEERMAAPLDPYPPRDETSAAVPLDPYEASDGPVDPYEDAAAPLDPYAGAPVGDRPASPPAATGAVVSGAVWGGGLGLLIAGAADGGDLGAGDYVLSGALGAAAGFGVASWLSGRAPSRDDVALVSSAGGDGLTAGLALGALANTDDAQGYSLAGALGAGAGLATGLWLATRTDVSADRLGDVDLGVGVGAFAPWALYALGGGGSDALQLTGAASLTMAAVGGWLAWHWTAPGPGADAAGLAARRVRGRRLAARQGFLRFAPHPLVLAPAAADPRARVGVGFDLVSGTF